MYPLDPANTPAYPPAVQAILSADLIILGPGSLYTSLLPNLLAERLPRRFAQAWCELHDWTRPLNQFRHAELRQIAASLADWQLTPSGTQGYAKAEVTLGGVDTNALSSKTMGARAVPGLHFIGEVMDVTGHLGGYNFQWAWSSGVACGLTV